MKVLGWSMMLEVVAGRITTYDTRLGYEEKYGLIYYWSSIKKIIFNYFSDFEIRYIYIFSNDCHRFTLIH